MKCADTVDRILGVNDPNLTFLMRNFVNVIGKNTENNRVLGFMSGEIQIL